MPKKKKTAMRDNKKKPQLSFLLDFPNATKEFAKICEFGADKYKRHNWKQGFPITEIEDSLLRHLQDFHNCEDDDVESKCKHAGHIMWNAAALIECLERHPELDNRDWENESE